MQDAAFDISAICASAINSVLNPIQDRLYFTNSRIRIQKVKRHMASQSQIRLLEPTRRLFGSSQRFLGACKHARHPHRPVTLFRRKLRPARQPPAQSTVADPHHLRQRLALHIQLFGQRRKRPHGQSLARHHAQVRIRSHIPLENLPSTKHRCNRRNRHTPIVFFHPPNGKSRLNDCYLLFQGMSWGMRKIIVRPPYT